MPFLLRNMITVRELTSSLPFSNTCFPLLAQTSLGMCVFSSTEQCLSHLFTLSWSWRITPCSAEVWGNVYSLPEAVRPEFQLLSHLTKPNHTDNSDDDQQPQHHLGTKASPIWCTTFIAIKSTKPRECRSILHNHPDTYWYYYQVRTSLKKEWTSKSTSLMTNKVSERHVLGWSLFW